MELKQLSVAEFRLDAIGDFNIIADGYHLALIGTNIEIPALELNCHKVPYKPFPYAIDYIPIPNERPCHSIIQKIDLTKIYATCNVLQSQELALEVVYVADSSLDPPKAKIQQLSWMLQQHNQPYLAMVTNYGACQIRTKNKTLRKWNNTVVDVNNLYKNEVFPLQVDLQNLNSFQEFKNIVDLHWITACTWHQHNLIYTANALGWIVALCFENLLNIKEYTKFDTNLGKISYIKPFGDFLLVGNVMGVVKLYRMIHASSVESVASIKEVECLWSKSDRMSCRKAEVTYSNDYDCYTVIFTKAANVLVYRLSADGIIRSSCTLYVGGIKITGIDTLSNNEFLVTTINGMVKHLRISFDSNSTTGSELKISEETVNTDLDVRNYQILGIAATPNKNLWSFMLFRNKPYARTKKLPLNSAFLSVCKLSTIKVLQKLDNMSLNTFDPYLDYIVGVHLDIVNNFEQDEYEKMYTLQNAQFSNELNDAFLQKLQLKLAILQSFLGFQKEKFKITKQATVDDMEFLMCCVQVTYIVCRLQHMQRTIGDKPTAFQTLAGRCLSLKFNLLIEILRNMAKNEQNQNKDIIDSFVKLAINTFQELSHQYAPCKELCLLCNEVTSDTMMCCNNHKTIRCCISYVQVPLFNSRHCIQCEAPALDDDKQLEQILTSDETLKCTFCRFSFVTDEI